MRIFALETDVNKITDRFCHEGECVLHLTRYHGMSFFFAVLRDAFLTAVLFSLGALAWSIDLPMVWTFGILFLVWFFFAFLNIVKAYLDWMYDLIIVTTDKIILVDQSSIFRNEIKPLHLENIGGISSRTQFWNIFPFGSIEIHLKEGMGGQDALLKYVPNAGEVAGKMSDAVTTYQRWRREVAEQSAVGATNAPESPAAARE